MARSKNKVNKGLPHHVKERLRHQILQKILEDVARHVPKPMLTKRETKAKKLRRIVLYMKYLIHRKDELNETKNAIKCIPECEDSAVKPNLSFPAVSLVPKSKRKRAHIVFLSKFADKAVNSQEDITVLTHKKCFNNMEIKKEIQPSENTVNTSCPKNVASSNNEGKSFHKAINKSVTNVRDSYIPNIEMENVSSYDIGLWKEDYLTTSRPSAEKKVGKTRNFISKDHIDDDCQNYFVHGKETSFNKLDRNENGLKQYIHEFSKDLKNMQRSFSPDKNLFQSGKIECTPTDFYNCDKGANYSINHKKSTSADEYSFHYIERPRSFNKYAASKNYQSSCDMQMDDHQLPKEPSFSQERNFSFKDMGLITSLNNFEMPSSFINSVTQKKQQCYDDIKMGKQQCSNHKMFSHRSFNSSSDESDVLASLHSFKKMCSSNCPVRPKSHQEVHFVKEDKPQLSKFPSFSQSSDNFSTEMFSSGESGTFISSNEYVLSENEQIDFIDRQYQITNKTPSASFKSESAMREDSYDFALTPPERNFDNITSPDIFCDVRQHGPHGSSNFSVDNILSKSYRKNSFSHNSERCLDYNILEPNYNIPVCRNNAVDTRFINCFSMNNYSQNGPLQSFPQLSSIENYRTLNTRDLKKYSNFVPNSESFMIDTYSPEKVRDINHSMYETEGVGNHSGVTIKQENTDFFLPPEELSYSLNNITNLGYCYSQKDFNAH